MGSLKSVVAVVLSCSFGLMGSARNLCASVVGLALALWSGVCFAQTDAIPDIGVDPSAYVTELGGKIGPVLGAVFGIFAAVLVVRLAWGFIRQGARG